MPACLDSVAAPREEASLREREAQVRRLRESQTRSADSQLQRVKHDESVRVFKTLLTELVRNHEVVASRGRRSAASPCVALRPCGGPNVWSRPRAQVPFAKGLPDLERDPRMRDVQLDRSEMVRGIRNVTFVSTRAVG